MFTLHYVDSITCYFLSILCPNVNILYASIILVLCCVWVYIRWIRDVITSLVYCVISDVTVDIIYISVILGTIISRKLLMHELIYDTKFIIKLFTVIC